MGQRASAKTALVTGGGRGLGQAISLALAAAGHQVAVNFRSNQTAAAKTVVQIQNAGGIAQAFCADVSDAMAVAGMADEISEQLGPVDILVNNAGYAVLSDVDTITLEAFEKTLRNNLTSAFLVTQACLPAMRKSSWGRIINISSTAAHLGGLVGVDYTASKAGMIGLTHAYARALMTSGITVNAIAPALIIEEEGAAAVRIADNPVDIPMGRFGLPYEVAEAVMLPVRNGYMTGQTISVNGGAYMT